MSSFAGRLLLAGQAALAVTMYVFPFGLGAALPIPYEVSKTRELLPLAGRGRRRCLTPRLYFTTAIARPSG